MKNIKKLLLLLPLTFTLGACSTEKDGSVIDLSSLISISNMDEDDIKDFLYDNSIASKKLKELANNEGYSFDFRLESEVLPDPNNQSVYFDVTLSGKDNLSWATVNQMSKDNKTTLASYQAVLEEDTNISYVNLGSG